MSNDINSLLDTVHREGALAELHKLRDQATAPQSQLADPGDDQTPWGLAPQPQVALPTSEPQPYWEPLEGVVQPIPDQPWYRDIANYFTGGPGSGFEGTDKFVQPVVQPLANFALQAGRGGTLYAGDLAWYAAQKIFPDMPKETLAKRLETPGGNELTGFAKTAGDIGEFMGGVLTAGALLRRLGIVATPAAAKLALPAAKGEGLKKLTLSQGKALLKRVITAAPPYATRDAIKELTEGIAEEKSWSETLKETAKGALRGAALGVAVGTVSWGADKLWRGIAAKYPAFAARFVKASEAEAHRSAEQVARHTRVEGYREYFRKNGRLPNEAFVEAGITPAEAAQPVAQGVPVSPGKALVPVSRDAEQMRGLLKTLLASAKKNAPPPIPDVKLPGSLQILGQDAEGYRTALDLAIATPDRAAAGQPPLPQPRLYPDDERVPPTIATYVTTQPSDEGLEITPRDIPQGIVANEMIGRIAEETGGSVLIEPRVGSSGSGKLRDRLYVVAGDHIVAAFDRGAGGWTPSITFDPERPWPALGDRTVAPRDEVDEVLGARLADQYAMKAEGIAEADPAAPVEAPIAPAEARAQTNALITQNTGATTPKELLAHYQDKYPAIQGVDLGRLEATKESGPLVNSGATKVVRDGGKFNAAETTIALTDDADLVTTRHEIEHLLDAIHGTNIEGRQVFGRYEHEQFADEYKAHLEAKQAAEVKAQSKALVPVQAPASVVPENAPSRAQVSYVHVLSRERGLSKEQYRAVARAVTGKSSVVEMTRGEVSQFIDALRVAPDPHYDELGNPVQPPQPLDPDAIALPGTTPPKYKTPSLLIPSLTPPEVYAETLGLGPLVRPIQQAKRSYDIELRGMVRQVETWGKEWQKLAGEGAGTKIKAKAKQKPTPSMERLANLLDTFEDPPHWLTDERKEIFNRFRNLTRILLARQNEVRARLGMELIKSRKAYIRYVIDHTSEAVTNGAFEAPKNLPPWISRHIAKKIFNPMEKARVSEAFSELFIKDPVYAFKAMLATGLKEVHLDEPLYYLTEHLKIYGEDIPTETHQWLNDYINLNVKGQMTSADRRANAMVTETVVGDALNLILKPFGRSITSRPVTNMMRFIGARQGEAVLGPRPKLMIRNLFQTVQNLAFSGIIPTLQGFGPTPAWMQPMLDRSQFLQVYEQEFMETSHLSNLSKVQQAYHAGYRWTAISNAKRAKKTGIRSAVDLVLNERHAKHGWRSPRRTGNEPEGFFYPEEQALIDRESDWTAGAAQYQYDALGMPQLYRGKLVGGIFRLASWPMNHFFRFHREAIHRVIHGKPSWSDGSVTLPLSRRLGLLRYLIIGGVVLNTLGYARSFLYGVPPSELPPTAQVIQHSSMYALHLAQGNKKQATYHKRRLGRALMTFIPAYYLSRDIKAVIDGTKHGWELFFYPPSGAKKDNKRSGK